MEGKTSRSASMELQRNKSMRSREYNNNVNTYKKEKIMFRRLKNRKGFTMIELMIVAIIVAILAVVLIPLMTGNKVRAYATEAEATLGTIRTAMRVAYSANNGVYPTYAGVGVDTCNTVAQGAGISNINFSTADLMGTYFSAPNFTITSAPATYTITCTWNVAANNAPQAAVIQALPVAYTTTLNEQGTFTRNY